MQVEKLWKNIRRSENCRIFHKQLVGSDSVDENVGSQGIFSLRKEEQPILVIDNTYESEDSQHNTVSSHLVEISDLENSEIRFEVALLEYVDGGSTNTSTVIVKYFSDKKKEIAEEKLNHKLFLGESKEVSIPIKKELQAAFLSIVIFVNWSNRLNVCYSGFEVGLSKREMQVEARTSKKVTMTVFNNFRNDTRVLREAKSLVELGMQVRIMAIYSTGQKEEEIIDGVRVSRVILRPFHLRWIRWWGKRGVWKFIVPPLLRVILMPLHRYLMFQNFEREVMERLRDDDSDVYHSHDLNTLRLGEKISRFHGKKLVYDSHELYLDRNRARRAGPIKRMMVRRFEKSLIRKCDRVITVNDSIADLLCHRYGISDVEVIMNTPPMQFFPPKNIGYNLREILSIDNDSRIAIYVGSIQHNRGLENLLRSMKFLENVHLVLMGYGDKVVLDNLETIAIEEGLAERYSLFGPVPSELVPLYTSSADIGVAPILNSCLSYYLCSPNKVFEYMHAGIPVVASDFPELRKVVIGEEIGTVFDPEKPEDIARSIREIVEDVTLREKFQLRSIESSRKYNWGKQSAKLQSMYIDLFSNQTIGGVDDIQNESVLQRYLEGDQISGKTVLGIENNMPGTRGWGSPLGRESVERFKVLLNSMCFRSNDELVISAVSSKDVELRAQIYRIGHYGGVGSRRLSSLGRKNVLGSLDRFEGLDSESIELEPILSTELGNDFQPGTYVVNVGDGENSVTLPFWIFGEGDILAVVPTIANRVRQFPNGSKERSAIFTNGAESMKGKKIKGNVNFVYPDGRGGEITKWVFPFCRWAEKNNIPVSWITDTELDRRPEEIHNFEKVVLLGDSRFWTENIHTAIGEHVSSSTTLANIGCGMGEQLVELDERGNFSFKNLNEHGEMSKTPICETWGGRFSPQRFGGTTENQILLNATLSNGRRVSFPLLGSWDARNIGDFEYNQKEVLALTGDTINSGTFEIFSREIRSFHGASIFLASMENWSMFLDENARLDADLAEEQSQYLSKFLTNKTSRTRDDLKLIKESITELAKKYWHGEAMSKQSVMKMKKREVDTKKICFLTTIWKRQELTSAFLSHVNFLKQELIEFDISCIVVGSEGKKTQEMVISSGNDYLEHENLPLSLKWNAGLKYSESFDPDAVIILGSDDFISPKTVRSLVEKISSGWLMTGLMDMHILDSKASRLFHWNGYSVNTPHRMWETIGLGRCLSRKLLEKVDFSLWDKEDIDRGLDGLMTRKLASIGLIPIPHGQEVWILLEDGEYAFGHSGIYSSDVDGFVVDVKTSENITALDSYSTAGSREVSNFFDELKKKIGDEATEKIILMGEEN